mgnify:CR=1 FL=1
MTVYNGGQVGVLPAVVIFSHHVVLERRCVSGFYSNTATYTVYNLFILIFTNLMSAIIIRNFVTDKDFIDPSDAYTLSGKCTRYSMSI